MDGIDRKILQSLKINGRKKNAELARELDIPATTCQERIRRLEERGIIKGYEAIIDTEKLGLGVQAYIAVSLNRHESHDIRDFEINVKSIANIKACYHISGRFDYLLHVYVKDVKALGSLVKTGITALPHFGRCETFLVFSEVASDGYLPSLQV